jgi:hypothetical protein
MPNVSDMQTPNFNIQQPTTMQQIGQGVSNFLGTPVGQLAQAAIPVATSYYGAQQASQNLNNLTNQLRAQVTPMAQYGQGVLGQLQGGAPVAGPAGQIIGNQLQGAQALAQAAQPYASGQLTQGQQLALAQAARGAAANTNLGYAMSGNPLSSANVAAQQGIQNQAIITAGQLQQQNIQFAQQALQSSQQVYNGLLQQSLSSAELGLAGFQPAVMAQIQGNQAISAQQQAILNSVAQGVVGANPQGPGGANAATQFGNIIGKMLGANQPGAVNQQTQPTTTQTDTSLPNYTDLTQNPSFSTANITGSTTPLPDYSAAATSSDTTTSSGDGTTGPP